MTKRLPVSAKQNVFFNSQNVDDTDLTLEQNYNNTITSSIINNHVGTGVLPGDLEQVVLFDSSNYVGFLDGAAIDVQRQPSDANFGNQLEIDLTGSSAASRRTVKVGVIGLDFQGNLQFETFIFKVNEIQIGKKHFTKILVLLFNDFIGDPNFSMNLGGKVVIREAKSMSLSRDPLMIAQDIEPNLFFRDFFTDGYVSLGTLLHNALPTYNLDTLNIFTNEKDNKPLLNSDVTTQIGQKFQATTNNIQKITLLLSVRNLDSSNPNDLVWNGDLVASVYPLQSDIDCPSDIAPTLPIDFSPSNIPLAQLSVNYSTLLAAGIVLDTVPQPVDFVFSNSPIAAGNILVPGNYYAIALHRSGSANKCDILIATGADRVPNSRVTVFTGNLWVDLPEEDLWFKVWNDAAKVSDGQAYDSGHGITIEKTEIDPATQATVDYSFDGLQFTGNDVYQAQVAAITLKTDPIPDQSTGNPILSHQQFVPQVNLLNSIDIVNLEDASEPLLIGAISDKNRKFYDSISSLIGANLHSMTMAENELLIRIIDDTTDSGRYDELVNSLSSHLLNGDFIGAKIVPNDTNPSHFYRIAAAQLCSMIVGDVNGDGLVDVHDLDQLYTYLNYDLNVAPPIHSILSTDGYQTTFENGYLTLTQPFTNLFSVNFQLVEKDTNIIVAGGIDGVLIAHPNNPRLAQFTSASVNFNTIIGLDTYHLVIFSPGDDANQGGFDIVSLDSIADVLTIRKVILTGDSLAEMLRADIDGDFHISADDGYLLESYINKLVLSGPPTTTYPAPATNPYTKIGTRFNVIRMQLEKYVDRADDYTPLSNGRGSAIHPIQDLFVNDGYLGGHDFYADPTPISIEKKLTWDESLIVVNSRAKLVPSIFSSMTGFHANSCEIDGIKCNVYPLSPDFDSGRVDVFAPDNIILGQGGEIKRSDGNFYKIDFEVGTVVMEIPGGLYESERTINVMDDFIADYTGNGVTRLGFPAMRYADCSYVQADDLLNDKIRFSVSVQSFSPQVDGLSDDGYYGVIVDGKIGVAVDYETGFVTLNFTNLYQDEVYKTLTTKVQVNVYMKRGGFNNKPLFVDSTKMQNMLKLITVFSGANAGGPGAQVDLANDTTGILPVARGGTGLNIPGATGTVLMSNGAGISYNFVTADFVEYIPANVAQWNNNAPSSVANALDRLASALGNVP